MNILLLILQILGIVILAVIVIACGILLLPAGVQISWKEQVTEVWLTAGPLRRRFYPPLPKKRKAGKQYGQTGRTLPNGGQ